MVRIAHTTSADFAFALYEHRQIKAELADIRAAADTVGRLSAAEAAKAVAHVRAWLATSLGPHTSWEDVVVYPEVERATSTKWATKLMRFEHAQIKSLSDVLDADVEALRNGTPTHERICDIRAHLLGLESMLRAHIEKEEKFLLPCLDNPERR